MKSVEPIRMVDISPKTVVHREAEAVGRILLKPETLRAIKEKTVKKGDPLTVAEVAALQAVKRTSELIPLCHPIPVTGINIDFTLGETHIDVRCRVKADYKTGVEMEALTGVAIALLTIWDMVKYLEKDEEGQYPHTRIADIRVVEKLKG